MTKILAVVNQKGGAAKTTLALHVGYAARRAGLRVLWADLDKQASLSLSVPTNGAQDGVKASELFTFDSIRLPESVVPDVGIIRADKLQLAKRVKEGMQVTEAAARNLRLLAHDYDLCVIDTPGSLGEDATTYVALMVADYVVCPFQVGLSELAALQDLWMHIMGVRNSINPKLKVLGLLPCRINTRSREERDFLASLRKQFGTNIMSHVLADRASVKQAVARRVPVWQGTKGDSHRKAGREWLAACEAILNGTGVTK